MVGDSIGLFSSVFKTSPQCGQDRASSGISEPQGLNFALATTLTVIGFLILSCILGIASKGDCCEECYC